MVLPFSMIILKRDGQSGGEGGKGNKARTQAWQAYGLIADRSPGFFAEIFIKLRNANGELYTENPYVRFEEGT